MTQITEGSVKRETGDLYKGKPLQIEISSHSITYKVKGARSPLTSINHLVAVEAGIVMDAKDKKGNK